MPVVSEKPYDEGIPSNSILLNLRIKQEQLQTHTLVNASEGNMALTQDKENVM